MAYDAHANFAYSTVATAPSPASSGTSLVVQTGDGANFPAAPFNATVWPAGSQPTKANSEIVRVTAIATDTFTITRTQESTSARTIVTGDQIAATITAKTLTDIEANATGSATVTPKYRLYTAFNAYVNGGTVLDPRITQTTNASATITSGTTGINFNISSTAGSYARADLRALGGGSFDGNLEIIYGFTDWVGTSDSYQHFYGCGQLTFAAAGITMTGKHIGWYGQHNASAATYKYSCADGTTQNSGTYAGTGGNNVGYIVKSGTTSIKYYYNGTLVGTLTTNIPTGTTQYPLSMGATNMNTANSNTGQAWFAEYTKEVY